MNITKLTFYVSNQCFDNDPVDIKITIDGKEKINQDFYLEGETARTWAGHNWIKFSFNVGRKKHVIELVSTKGNATLTQEIELTEKKHLIIADYYCHSNPSLGETFSFVMLEGEDWWGD